MNDKEYRKQQTAKMTTKLLKFIFLFISVLILLTLLTSCEDTIMDELPDNYTLELDSRLDTTDDGLYKLELNSTQNSIQTIHRISGNF